MSEHDELREQHGQATSEDVIVPLDTGAMLADEAPESDVDANLQTAIDAVARDLGRDIGDTGDTGDTGETGETGTRARDKDLIRTSLRAQLERHGVWPQPEPWFESVVDSLVTGTPYRVRTE